jgi:hypothetical protein
VTLTSAHYINAPGGQHKPHYTAVATRPRTTTSLHVANTGHTTLLWPTRPRTTTSLQVANTGHTKLLWPARPHTITTLQVANTSNTSVLWALTSAHYIHAPGGQYK